MAVEEPLKKAYQNIHQGYQTETLVCFLKAREWNVAKAHKMPSASKYYGRPITTCVKVWDMTGLKLSALSRIKVVKPLLQERTRKKIQVLSGNGQDELLKIMDFAPLPHFCKREGSGPSRHSENGRDHCFSLNHPFHQQLYGYVKQQALSNESAVPVKQGSLHVDLPEPAAEGMEIAKTIESEFR